MESTSHLNDDDWAAIRAAVPSFAATWKQVVGERSYDPTIPFLTIHAFAEFVIKSVVRQRPEELHALGDALEVEYTRAWINEENEYQDLLTVGLLEGLIEAADETGMPLTWLTPFLRGEHLRQAWDEAVGWKRPDYIWSDEYGPITLEPEPYSIGTVEIQRASRMSDEIVRLDVRLVGGQLRSGDLLRRCIGKGFWSGEPIIMVRQRSHDVADEFEIEIESETVGDYDSWDTQCLDLADQPFWQIAATVLA